MRKDTQKIKLKKRLGRVRRTRAKIMGTKDRPRVSVFRSLQHIYVQIIDDDKGKTLVAVSNTDLKSKAKINKLDEARAVGKLAAERALEKKIKQVVFDRRGYKYHGRVRALAEGMRENGVSF